MSEKGESDEFEDEDAEEPIVEDGDVDLDQVNKDLDLAKKRGQKVGDPAWRRLERLLSQAHCGVDQRFRGLRNRCRRR